MIYQLEKDYTPYTKEFTYKCLESFLVTNDTKYIKILLDDHYLFEAYDSEWMKANALGDQTTDTNSATSDTNSEIKMLRAMLRTAINKPEDYIREKIKWLNRWKDEHFSKSHIDKMDPKEKSKWDKVKEKANSVIQSLENRLKANTSKYHFIEQYNSFEIDSSYLDSSLLEDGYFDKSIDTDSIILTIDESIDILLQEGLFGKDKTRLIYGNTEKIDDNRELGVYSYNGSSRDFLLRSYDNKERIGERKKITDPTDKALNKLFGNGVVANSGDNYQVNDIIDGKHEFMLMAPDDSVERAQKKLDELYKESEKGDHPKSWFSKMIFKLRRFYTRLLSRIDACAAQDDPKGVFKQIKNGLAKIASKVMHLIDRFLAKIQRMAD